MKPCCEQMIEMMSMNGQRLFSAHLPDEEVDIEAVSMNNVPHLIFRSFNAGQEQDVHIDTEVPVSVEGKIGFRFCPWCGTALT